MRNSHCIYYVLSFSPKNFAGGRNSYGVVTSGASCRIFDGDIGASYLECEYISCISEPPGASCTVSWWKVWGLPTWETASVGKVEGVTPLSTLDIEFWDERCACTSRGWSGCCEEWDLCNDESPSLSVPFDPRSLRTMKRTNSAERIAVPTIAPINMPTKVLFEIPVPWSLTEPLVTSVKAGWALVVVGGFVRKVVFKNTLGSIVGTDTTSDGGTILEAFSLASSGLIPSFGLTKLATQAFICFGTFVQVSLLWQHHWNGLDLPIALHRIWSGPGEVEFSTHGWLYVQHVLKLISKWLRAWRSLDTCQVLGKHILYS